MSWVAAGIAGGTIVGGLISAQGATNAAGEQSAATRAGINENARQYDLSRADLEPYRNAGAAALDQLRSGLGIGQRGPATAMSGPIARDQFDAQAYLQANPDVAQDHRYAADPYQHYVDYGLKEGRQGYKAGPYNIDSNAPLAKKFTLEDFNNDPVNQASMQFGMTEGQKAIQRLFGSRGMSRSGAATKAAERFATDYAGTKAGESYNRFYADQDRTFNRDAALAGIGQTATTSTASLGANASGNNSMLLSGEGNARGAASIARSNALGGAVNQVGNQMYGQYTLDRILASRSPSSPSSNPQPSYTYEDPYGNIG